MVPITTFGFTDIAFNLPCAPDYDPDKPRVLKVDAQGRPSSYCCMFCDEGRMINRD
jgi:hypothetical protein